MIGLQPSCVLLAVVAITQHDRCRQRYWHFLPELFDLRTLFTHEVAAILSRLSQARRRNLHDRLRVADVLRYEVVLNRAGFILEL